MVAAPRAGRAGPARWACLLVLDGRLGEEDSGPGIQAPQVVLLARAEEASGFVGGGAGG